MFKKRKTNAIDYPVMALEGLLWLTEGDMFDITIKDNWSYTLMIMQPEVITQEIFEEAREQVRKKKGDSKSLSRLQGSPTLKKACAFKSCTSDPTQPNPPPLNG